MATHKTDHIRFVEPTLGEGLAWKFSVWNFALNLIGVLEEVLEVSGVWEKPFWLV